MLGRQSGLGGRLEDLADAGSVLGRALDVGGGSDLLGNGLALLPGDGALVHAGEVLDGLRVVTQVLLARDEDDGKSRAEVLDLGDPLFLNVVQRVGRVDRVTDKNDVRVGVRQGTETVAVTLVIELLA